jgi:hypothetical protein
MENNNSGNSKSLLDLSSEEWLELLNASHGQLAEACKEFNVKISKDKPKNQDYKLALVETREKLLMEKSSKVSTTSRVSINDNSQIPQTPNKEGTSSPKQGSSSSDTENVSKMPEPGGTVETQGNSQNLEVDLTGESSPRERNSNSYFGTEFYETFNIPWFKELIPDAWLLKDPALFYKSMKATVGLASVLPKKKSLDQWVNATADARTKRMDKELAEIEKIQLNILNLILALFKDMELDELHIQEKELIKVACHAVAYVQEIRKHEAVVATVGPKVIPILKEKAEESLLGSEGWDKVKELKLKVSEIQKLSRKSDKRDKDKKPDQNTNQQQGKTFQKRFQQKSFSNSKPSYHQSKQQSGSNSSSGTNSGPNPQKGGQNSNQ